MSATETEVLACEALRVGYGDGPDVLRDVTVRLPAAGLVGILGESGCGKSTLLSALLGLGHGHLQLRGGALRYQGHDVTRLSPWHWRRLRGPELAMVFQTPSASFAPLERLAGQFVESVRVHSPRASERACLSAASDLLRRLRFDDPAAVLAAYPYELSGGMLQRAAIALALLSEPRVLLADEPTSALDVYAQAEVVELLGETAQDLGTAVLFVSHQVRLTARLVDELHVLHGGQVVESGPSQRVLAHPAHPVTQRLIAAIPTLEEHSAA